MQRREECQVPPPETAPAPPAPELPLEAWLAQGLHARWDSVASEPLPEEILALLRAAC